MKNLKSLSVVALIIAVAASAFTIPARPGKALSVVWQYEPVNGNGPSDPANYVKLSETESFTCIGDELVCQISADENMQTHKPLIQSGDNPAVDVAEYNTSFRNN